MTTRLLICFLCLLLAICGGLIPYASAQPADLAVSAEEVVAPRLPLALTYTENYSPADYLVSEKLDGVRAYWDGRSLKFRSGRVIHAPAWFIASFPAHPLDGELWMGRHTFERLSAAVRRDKPDDAEWKRITYQLYEWPGGSGSFSDRIAALQVSVAQADVRWLRVLPQVRGTDQAALKSQLMKVVRGGGEGLMLHRADALWQTGRSDILLKLKLQQDAEATVVGYEPGQGKYRGMLGALVVVMPDGRRFRLGTGFTDAARRNPPSIGSVVTYRYRDLTASGLPKFVSFWRVRDSE